MGCHKALDKTMRTSIIMADPSNSGPAKSQEKATDGKVEYQPT